MKLRSTFTATLGIAAAATLTLAGCSASPGEAGGDGLSIVTTTTQVTDFVERLVDGTDATVSSLLLPGESAHSFEADPADLVAVGGADLVVASGFGLEEAWLPPVLEAGGYTGATVNAGDGFDPAMLQEGAGHAAATGGAGKSDHDHGDEADGHDHGDEADGHDHGDEADGHDHGGADPHVWTAPLGASFMVGVIADALAEADPDNADAYRANAGAYQAQLEELDLWIGQNVAQVAEEDRLLVTNHEALTYYTDGYRITVIGSIMPSWDDNAEPSAAELDTLITAITASGVPAVFSESQLSPATAERIATETGVKVYSGDEALLTDSLGEPGTDAATYIGATVHNTVQILDSWGAAASELPTELQGA
ncbi:ABC transporter substrate-binding protein [Pseudoclavibacter endophyticus]|uniref:metal ABC transporter substrate-binding protein n=1 Tax=Pseudoclavibacter endophyticus TaxID=1778590 RepID=UPI0019A7A870|nr:metal ABC transporter substrate-binding protein [Pseudoclavibacter endophyticus]GGA67668.1 ABC transporter substrate-binding protein [Pseudoclavibacter endophyticus]